MATDSRGMLCSLSDARGQTGLLFSPLQAPLMKSRARGAALSLFLPAACCLHAAAGSQQSVHQEAMLEPRAEDALQRKEKRGGRHGSCG